MFDLNVPQNLFLKTILRFWFKDIFTVCVWFSDLLSLNEPRMTWCFYIYIFDTCVYIRGYSWLFRIGPIYGQYQIGWSDTVALKNMWLAERRFSFAVHIVFIVNNYKELALEETVFWAEFFKWLTIKFFFLYFQCTVYEPMAYDCFW